MTTVAKKQTIGNFLSIPKTQAFLEDNLKEKRSEFVSNLIALSDSDSNIANCDPHKLMMCAMNATALNLPLNKNLGFAYIIAYGGVPSFQIGYKGLLQLAIRTGAYKTINACEIREGEIKQNKVTGEIKILGEYPDKPIVGYMAHLELLSGFTASLYMTEEQIEAHALRFSKSYQYDKNKNGNSSKWSDPLARPKMAMKTVLKGLLGTYGVLTTDMNNALSNDNENEFESGNRSDIPEAQVIPQDDNGKKVKLTELKK